MPLTIALRTAVGKDLTKCLTKLKRERLLIGIPLRTQSSLNTILFKTLLNLLTSEAIS